MRQKVYNEYVERQERKVRIMNGGLIFVFCFFGGLALMCFIVVKVMDFIDKRNDRKRHKEHPEFFRLYDDYDEKGNIACRFYNSEIAPSQTQSRLYVERRTLLAARSAGTEDGRS